MKILTLLLISASWLLSWNSSAAQTADARMWCWSVRFHEGTQPSDLYSLDLTTLESGVNGELAPLFGDFTHWAWFNLNDMIFDEIITGILNMDTPEFTDADGDGFDDFFDVSKGVSATTSGIYAFDFEGVTRNISASWSRGAGSAAGTCVITLQGYGDYTHTFELIEYNGVISYTPASGTVAGSAQLTNAANSAEIFQGPVSFVKSITDPFNLLRLQAGHWTNAFDQPLPFAENNYFRDAAWPTNYYGYFDFDDDGNLTTFQPYSTWYLTIDDLNDTDGDGIPDFSDNPTAVTRPELVLRPSSTNLVLLISGQIGRTYEVQAASAVSTNTWQPVVSVALTNSPQPVALPLPGVTRFWRALLK